MAKPARKQVAQAFREALGADLIDFSIDVERSLSALGLDLSDLDSALRSCKAYWNNTAGAGGAPEVVIGTTIEGITLNLEVWINPDSGAFMVESVSLAPGATGDAESEHEQIAESKSANDP